MRNKILFHPAVLVVALTLPAIASAASAPASAPKTAPVVEQSNITWSAATGLGYDSNAYRAPRASYVDYGALPIGSNPTVVPQAKSGFFVPYEIKADMAKIRDQDSRMLASAKADGSFYLGSGLSNASEYNMGLHGGFDYVLAREGKSEDTFYVGALIENHKRVYVDHDSGLGKTTTLSGRDISGLYSYTSFGVEAEYKHRTGKLDYGLNGKYTLNDYENPPGAPQQDHSYYTLGADTSIPVATRTDLNLSFDHSVRDYSNRHSRDLQALFTTSLLAYTYNTFGATLRNRLSPDWLLYLDIDHALRADNNVGYGDYKESRYGARLLYGQDRLKARLALHHWGRDYPNGFAFDVAGQAAKTYSGNVLKLKAELEQTKNTALWTELVYEAQNTTDLRYDYVRKQIMAGMSWAY
ncbi:MAG TPA: hypothetical protein VIH29_09090 [Gallionella sp.]